MAPFHIPFPHVEEMVGCEKTNSEGEREVRDWWDNGAVARFIVGQSGESESTQNRKREEGL